VNWNRFGNRQRKSFKRKENMRTENKIVDGFRFMPPGLKAYIAKTIPSTPFSGYIPWTPMKRSLRESTFSLMTSAGINMKKDPPFDMEREKREPTWGDPTYREILKTATEADIDVNHWHVRNDYIKEDMNVMLPIKRFIEFEEERIIGKLVPTCYSFYGFQLNPKVLLEETMPKVSSRMKEEGVEAVLLTPS
jgi:D-proline reductase (dithiol) PrdB